MAHNHLTTLDIFTAEVKAKGGIKKSDPGALGKRQLVGYLKLFASRCPHHRRLTHADLSFVE